MLAARVRRCTTMARPVARVVAPRATLNGSLSIPMRPSLPHVVLSRSFAKKASGSDDANAAPTLPKPPKTSAAKKAPAKRPKAKEKAEGRVDVLANILEQATPKMAVDDKKVSPPEQKGLILVQQTPNTGATSNGDPSKNEPPASDGSDGGLPTVLPAFVLSDYHSYILPGITRHVDATPFHQGGLKLDKSKFIAIFLERKNRGTSEAKPAASGTTATPAAAFQPSLNLENAHPIGVIASAMEGAEGVVLHGICRICQISPQPGPSDLKTQSVNYYVLNDDPYDPADTEQKENVDAVKALIRQALNLWPRVVPSENWDPGAPPSSWADRGLEIFLKIQSFSPDDHDLVQEYINTLDVGKRLRRVRDKLQSLMDYHARTTQQIRQLEEKQIRQQQIRAMNEQLKVLKSGDEKLDEKEQLVAKYNARLKELVIPAEQLKVIQEEMQKMLAMEGHMSEYTTIRTWLDIVTQLPWGKFSNDSLDISRAKKILSEDHYGLSDVKQRILEFIAVSHLKGGVQGKILLFLGPPGVGKTSVGKSIARALGRQFFRFSVGGGYDVSEFKGHRRTYVAALPGKIINGLKQVKTSNPVILIDEIDKLGRGYHGDPMAALLEILDPEQNSTFVDHYVDLPFDLSKVLFLCTANERDPLSQPLQDRMEIIKFSGYTAEEKMHIARGYVIPQVMAACGLKESQLVIEESALKELIDHYSFEYGVRGLKRCIEQIMRKAARKVVEFLGLGMTPPPPAAAEAPRTETKVEQGKGEHVEAIIAPSSVTSSTVIAPEPATSNTVIVPSTPAVSASALEQEPEDEKVTSLPIVITRENINKYLSRALRQEPKIIAKPLPPGYSLGLAYSGSLSGSVMPIEVVVDRSGDSAKLKATGKLGDVLRESGDISYTFAKNFLKEKIPDSNFFERSALHLHLPQGAISKEGPSAGIALVTALLSLALNRPIREDLAMTGELTLLGHVLAIGGVKEKTMGAKSYGIKTLIFPHTNKADWDELPPYLRAGVEAHFVKTYSEVFDIAFDTHNSDPVAALRDRLATEKQQQQQQQQQSSSQGSEDDKTRAKRVPSSPTQSASAMSRMEPLD